jgi:hypothetical protein
MERNLRPDLRQYLAGSASISLVRNLTKVHLPGSCQSHPTAVGRDLPDADGPGYVSLNGGFREANRSLIGQLRPAGSLK